MYAVGIYSSVARFSYILHAVPSEGSTELREGENFLDELIELE